MSGQTRLIKWMGDPPALIAGTHPVPRVANWHYENRRSIALPGFAERIVLPYATVRDEIGQATKVPNGLSRAYHWERTNRHRVIEMDADDWAILHAQYPYEFLDVTDVPDPDAIENKPLIYARPDDARSTRHSAGGHRLTLPQRHLGHGR